MIQERAARGFLDRRDNHMADETFNDAHIPDSSDPVPPNTHGTPTPRESVAPAELAAGTVNVASQPAPTKIDPVVVGGMSNPTVSPEPSGATIRSFSPSGIHDVNHNAEPTRTVDSSGK